MCALSFLCYSNKSELIVLYYYEGYVQKAQWAQALNWGVCLASPLYWSESQIDILSRELSNQSWLSSTTRIKEKKGN